MGEKKIMMLIVATNVLDSRLPERRPTGTPTARVKNKEIKTSYKRDVLLKVKAHQYLERGWDLGERRRNSSF